jgi:hypothetical protein
MASSPESGGISTPWGQLSWSQAAEQSAPGAAIGLLGGVIAGALLAMGGLSLPLVIVATLGLAVPLAAAGAVYEILLAKGRLPMGTLAGAAMVWVVLFPPIRVVHAVLIDLAAGSTVAVPNGLAAFAVYQVLVAVPFAIGFWWLHENFAPRWWFHIRDRNPVANEFIRVQLQYAEQAEEQKELQRLRRERRQAERQGRGRGREDG